MADEYIRKKDALDAIEARITELMTHPEFRRKHFDIDLSGIIRNIAAIKPADVVPAAQGEQRLGTWIVHGIYARCSECKETGGTILNGDKPEPFLTKFCPNCGVKMRKVAVRWEAKA